MTESKNVSGKNIPTRILHSVGFRHVVSILLLFSACIASDNSNQERIMDRKKRNSLIRYIILFVVFAAVAAGLYYFFSLERNVEYTPPVSPVVTVMPEYRRIDEGISVTGYIEAEAMIPVVPFVSGTVEEYLISAGDVVEKGSVIAVIDKRPYELQLRQAEAQVQGLEAAFTRVEALRKSGGATAQDYDTLSAQLEAARAQIELAELQLSYATVTSPVSGTVIQAPSSAGSVGSQEMPLAIIADLDDLVVNLKLGEKYFHTIMEKRDNLMITVSSPDGYSSGTELLSISPYVDPVSKTFQVKVRLASPEGFVPGMFIRAAVTWSSKEYLTLPLAVRKLDGSVYAIADDGKSAEYIEMGDIAEDSSYFAIDPSYEGRTFIIRGQNGLLPGEEVRIIKEER